MTESNYYPKKMRVGWWYGTKCRTYDEAFRRAKEMNKTAQNQFVKSNDMVKTKPP